jgi:hypothetical protein
MVNKEILISSQLISTMTLSRLLFYLTGTVKGLCYLEQNHNITGLNQAVQSGPLSEENKLCIVKLTCKEAEQISYGLVQQQNLVHGPPVLSICP